MTDVCAKVVEGLPVNVVVQAMTSLAQRYTTDVSGICQRMHEIPDTCRGDDWAPRSIRVA